LGVKFYPTKPNQTLRRCPALEKAVIVRAVYSVQYIVYDLCKRGDITEFRA